jgi:hypothetical protein
MTQEDICGLLKFCLYERASDIVDSVNQFSDVEREVLFKQLIRFRIASLFYSCAVECDVQDMIPGDIKHRLKEIYLQVAARNARLLNEAARVLEVFKENGIPVIALKGIYLAENIYGNVAMRPMIDIDLLLNTKDLVRAGRLLLSCGYSVSAPYWEAMGLMDHHLPCFSRPGIATVELHWNIAHPESHFKIDIDGLWERAQPATISGVQALVLSQEDLLLHLCLHLSFFDQFRGGLITLYDIAKILSSCQNKISWDELRLRSRQWGATKCLYLTFILTQRLFGVGAPDHFMDDLRPDDFDSAFLNKTEGYIFEEATYNRAAGIRASNLESVLKSNDPRGSFSTLLRGVFPPKEIISRRYLIPVYSTRIYFYYPAHWFRLIKDYSCLVWQLVSQDKTALVSLQQQRKRDALCRWMAP